MTDPSHDVDRITAGTLGACLAGGERLVILDVRRREAWATDPTRVRGAVWLPLEEVPRWGRELSPEVRLVVYCS